MSAKSTISPARLVFSERVIWTAALVLCALATAEAAVLALLAPMKTAQTEATLIDKRAGTSAALAPGVSAALTPDITRALLMQYLRARETFDNTDIRQNYAKVVVWSAPAAANEYRSVMARANPESPLALYPARTTVSLKLKAISFLSDDTALVRFDVQRQDGGNRPAPLTPYTSVISFGFAPDASSDIALNPLGFRVTQYTRSADAGGLGILSAAGK